MRLFLMRHGRASPAAGKEGPALTEKGRQEARKVGVEVLRRHREAGGGALRILSSPLSRARETADILAKEFSADPPEVTPVLDSGAPVTGMLELLKARMSCPALALVAHMPEMGELGWWLATGNRSGAFALAPATAVFLDLIALEPEFEVGEKWILAAEDLP